jgi:hypothetical protein
LTIWDIPSSNFLFLSSPPSSSPLLFCLSPICGTTRLGYWHGTEGGGEKRILSWWVGGTSKTARKLF